MQEYVAVFIEIFNEAAQIINIFMRHDKDGMFHKLTYCVLDLQFHIRTILLISYVQHKFEYPFDIVRNYDRTVLTYYRCIYNGIT